MNPRACARRAKDVLATAGLAERRVAVVSGDDLLPRLDELLASGHALNHLDTGEPLASIRDKVVSANAYLGAKPIVDALALGASVVITGRVADASLTVGPVAHEFGWGFGRPRPTRAATVAGHLIECGAQATGGLWINADDSTRLAERRLPDRGDERRRHVHDHEARRHRRRGERRDGFANNCCTRSATRRATSRRTWSPTSPP